MTVSLTQLRQDLYRIIDRVLTTGEPVIVRRKGRIIRIVADTPTSIWDRLEVHENVIADPESIVHLDWSTDWSGEIE